MAEPPVAMAGEIFAYHGKPGDLLLVAHAQPSLLSAGNLFAVFVGGMYDALLCRSYLPPLQASLAQLGFAFIAPLLSSSGSAWGVHSLHTDCRDLCRLFDFVLLTKPQARFILIGSSTGCQDIVAFLRVSKEYLVTLPGTLESLQAAERLIAEGKAEELMPRSTLDVPITASRFHAIVARGGDDDMFSSDFTAKELTSLLGHVAAPTLLVFSTKDQYYSARTSDVSVDALSLRLTAAFPKGSRLLLEENHFLDMQALSKDDFARAVIAFLQQHRISS